MVSDSGPGLADSGGYAINLWLGLPDLLDAG